MYKRQLLISVSAPDEAIATAETETMELLRRLSRGELPDAEIARALSDEKEARLTLLSDPRERIGSIFDGVAADPAEPTKPAELRAWMTQNLKPDSATIVVARPE